MKVLIAPSILSADFSCLAGEIKRVEEAGADMLHVDVMDGHFVENITIGPCVIKDMRKHTRLPLDVHLMIENPQRYIDAFVRAGSDMLTLHIETIGPQAFRRQAAYLKKRGVKVGLSLNPRTPLQKIKSLLSVTDFVLVMAVNPGFGGQVFMPEVLPKIRKLRALFNRDIAVDGGINEATARQVLRAGANILAAGSYLFKARDVKGAMERIRNCNG